MIGFLWRLFEKQFISYYVATQNKPVDLKELSLSLTDSNGKAYYGFTEETALPEIRFAKLQEYLIWLSNGLSSNTLDELIGVANKALEDGVSMMADNKPVNAIKIGAVLNEISRRKDMIKPVDLLFNILAVQLVREDEDARTFNQDIQDEKVRQFKEENEKGNYFFFRLPEFKKLFESTLMSEDEWKKYYKSSIQQINQNKESLKYLRSSGAKR